MRLRVVAAFLVACLAVLVGEFQSVTAASTERPYQFGFTIDKNQHRQEKKDERGIVMGEFGFITADGIYHVTVYATDEEGKFRILAMRSYPYEEHPKTIDMIVQPKRKPNLPALTTERATPEPITRRSFTVEGCSGCFIKTSLPNNPANRPHDKKSEIRPLSKPLSLNSPAGKAGKKIAERVLPHILNEVKQVERRLQQTPERGGLESRLSAVTTNPSTRNTLNAKTQTQQSHKTHNTARNAPSGGPFSNQAGNNNQAKAQAGKPLQGTNVAKSFSTNAKPGTNAGAHSGGSNAKTNGFATPGQPKTGQTGKAGGVNYGSAAGSNGKTGGGGGGVGGSIGGGIGGSTGGSTGGGIGKAMSSFGSIAARSGFGAGKTTNSGAGGSGVRAIIGDPGDLYRFKYILDYNGHTETGARNGNKEGSFFAIGDDNVERTIEYIANEFGFQPRIRWRKLDTPVQSKENTLKDYEFVWFK